MRLQATFEFNGLGDYWGGNGRRWDDDAGCLFATYGPRTTLQDVVEQWVMDFNSGGDCDTFPQDVTDKEVPDRCWGRLSSWINEG